MAIDYQLLVTAPMLQDFLIGKDGLPLAAGVITLYHDDSRTILKNWYYQSGTPGNYTYIPLPNPMTLSASGTIEDINGNDTIPFFYPYTTSNTNISERDAYFIRVVNSNGELQFTRANFPFLPPEGPTPPGENINTLENYIVNNRFWRNYGTAQVGIIGTDASTTSGIDYIQQGDFGAAYNTPAIPENYFYVTLAPSQNDGFSMPDYNYIKNANDADAADEVITFQTFLPAVGSTITLDVQPEYYVQHNCISNVSGATLKVHQFPIQLHVGNLIGTPFTVTIQAKAATGNNVMTVSLYQFLGTGVLSPAPVQFASIPLNSSWDKYSIPFTFPGNLDLNLSTANDDAWYIQFGMPTANQEPFDISFTLPSLYLSAATDIPTNNLETYDQIDSIISKPRTGDIRTSLNKFYFYGWVPMNNGTIGYQPVAASAALPTARNNQDTWPLFNLIWNLFKPYNISTVNPIAQMYTTGGAATPVGYGVSAIADWNSHYQIALTRSMGSVLLGTVPITALLPTSTGFAGYKATYTAASYTGATFAGGTVTGALSLNNPDGFRFFLGEPLVFSNPVALNFPGNITAATVYYAVPLSPILVLLADSFANALTINNGGPTPSVIPFSTTGSGTNTVYAALSGSYEGEFGHVQLVPELAAHTHPPLGPNTNFTGQSGTATATLAAGATVAGQATTGSTGSSLPFNVTQPGTFNNIYIKL